MNAQAYRQAKTQGRNVTIFSKLQIKSKFCHHSDKQPFKNN